MKKILQLETIEKFEENKLTFSEEHKIVQFPTEQAFYKIYVTDIANILELTGAGTKLLHVILQKMDWENIITLTSRYKLELSEKTGIKTNHINNLLVDFVKKNLFKRLSRSEYLVNPHYFSKGDWSETLKKRGDWQLTITYKNNEEKIIEARGININ